MSLDLPIQNAVDRRAGYSEFFLRRAVPSGAAPSEIEEWLLDPPFGAYGAVIGDPPAFRGCCATGPAAAAWGI